MRFICTLILAAIALSPLPQADKQAKSKKATQPKLVYKHVKARHKQLKAEVLKQVVYPLLCESDKPIEEIIIDFCPEILGRLGGEHGCDNEAQGKLTISITVNRFDGASGVVWIERNRDGSFDNDEYLKFFDSERGDRAPKVGCASQRTTT